MSKAGRTTRSVACLLAVPVLSGLHAERNAPSLDDLNSPIYACADTLDYEETYPSQLSLECEKLAKYFTERHVIVRDVDHDGRVVIVSDDKYYVAPSAEDFLTGHLHESVPAQWPNNLVQSVGLGAVAGLCAYAAGGSRERAAIHVR